MAGVNETSGTASKPSDLPAPLTSADCEMHGIEPPWELFIRMAVEQYGVSEAEARRVTADLRGEHHRKIMECSG